MKVVCVFFGAIVAAIHGQAYVSYYGQDLHHPTLSKESNTPEEAQLYQQDNSSENQQDLLSKLLLKHYGFDGEEQLPQNIPKTELQHHITKRNIELEHLGFHYPIIGPNGVPLETPAVRRARQQHLLAHEAAKEREYHPHNHEYDDEETVSNLISTHPDEYGPYMTKSGVPVDTPEVQEARKEHLAAIERERIRQYKAHLKRPYYHYEDEFPYDRDYYG